MNEAPTADHFATADWYKSSYSAADNECVEVAHTLRGIGIRDSKGSGQHGFAVSPGAFATFVNGLKDSPSSHRLSPHH
ncbi:DUF397 domain-containing protein [Streptomyces sp. NPDC014676]|uniref:DUF397 domain-containing protein n=1 Tax=Streptomyces sp. NPDC014676 TaxID=3364879 RepID=UPI0036F6554F